MTLSRLTLSETALSAAIHVATFKRNKKIVASAGCWCLKLRPEANVIHAHAESSLAALASGKNQVGVVVEKSANVISHHVVKRAVLDRLVKLPILSTKVFRADAELGRISAHRALLIGIGIAIMLAKFNTANGKPALNRR